MAGVIKPVVNQTAVNIAEPINSPGLKYMTAANATKTLRRVIRNILISES